MTVEKPVVKMYKAIYVGPMSRLRGVLCNVLCRSDRPDGLRAKFLTKEAGQLTYGWHDMLREDFDIDYFDQDVRL